MAEYLEQDARSEDRDVIAALAECRPPIPLHTASASLSTTCLVSIIVSSPDAKTRRSFWRDTLALIHSRACVSAPARPPIHLPVRCRGRRSGGANTRQPGEGRGRLFLYCFFFFGGDLPLLLCAALGKHAFFGLPIDCALVASANVGNSSTTNEGLDFAVALPDA